MKKTALIALAFVCLGQPAHSAELELVGTGDGMELLQSVADAYNGSQDANIVNVPPSIGSGGAVTAVGAERTSLGRIARPLSDKERAQGLYEVPIMKIPSAIYVHPSSGVTDVTAEQLTRIFAGQIANWKEIGGVDLRVRIVRREEADSTLAVLRAGMPGWRDLEITKRSKLAMTTQEAIETVKEVPGAVGFGPYSTALEANTTILRIDGKHPLDSAYPSAVTLSLLYKDGKLSPEADGFIQFARSSVGHDLMQKWGAVPIQ